MKESRIKRFKDRLKGPMWLVIIGFIIAILYVGDVSYNWGEQKGLSEAKSNCELSAYLKIGTNNLKLEKDAFGYGDKKSYNYDDFSEEITDKVERLKEDPKIKEFVTDIFATK